MQLPADDNSAREGKFTQLAMCLLLLEKA